MSLVDPTDVDLVALDALSEHEQVIERGLQSFIEVGNALIKIKMDRLYRAAGFGTFEGYCQDRWNISRNYGYRLVSAAAIHQGLVDALPEVLPIGNTLPTKESQVRPLTNLEPAVAAEVWQAAVESADGAQPTAKQVESAVAHVTQTTRTTESTKIERDIDLESGEIVTGGGVPEPQLPVTPPVAPLMSEPQFNDAEDNAEQVALGHLVTDIGAINAAIEEFPFLDDYPYEDVVRTAEALRAIPEGPARDKRIEAAKTWPLAVAARDEINAAGSEHPQVTQFRNQVEAAIDAARELVTNAPGHFHRFDPDELDDWTGSLINAARDIDALARPTVGPVVPW